MSKNVHFPDTFTGYVENDMNKMFNLRNTRGFIQLSLAGWGVLIMGTIVLILGVSLKIQTARLDSEQEAHAKTKAAHRLFVADVKARGEAAEKKAKEQEAADRKRKETADVQIRNLRASLADARKRVRDHRNSPAGSLLPAPSPAAKHPERASFNRAELDRALRDFEAGIEGLIAEGDDSRVGLDTAKRWAQ